MKREWLVALIVVVGCKSKSIHDDNDLRPSPGQPIERPPEVTKPEVVKPEVVKPETPDAPPAAPAPAKIDDPVTAWAQILSAPTLDAAKLAELYAGKPHHEDADETQRESVEEIAGGAAVWTGKAFDPQIILRDAKHGAALVLADGHYGIAAFSINADNKITSEYVCFDSASPHAPASALAKKIEIKIDDTKDADDFAFKFDDAWDHANAKWLESMLADDVVIYDSSEAADIKGKAEAMKYAKRRWKAMPKRHSAYKPLWAAGDYVVDVVGWFTDKMKSGLMDCQLIELKHGKIKSYWVVRDTAAVKKQM